MVLVWPNKMQRLSFASGDEYLSNTSTIAVIVGFSDSNDSSIVIIGAITSDQKLMIDLSEEVTSTIEELARCCPCCSRESDDESKDCSECRIYQSLRVIAIFDENNIARKNAERQKEIIIYNVNEANSWETNYNQFRRQNYEVGSLQRNLIRTGKSAVVFEELSLRLKENMNSHLHHTIKDTSLSITSKFKIPSDYNTESNCNKEIEEDTFCFWKQSLLSIHWNSTFSAKQIPLAYGLTLWKGRRFSTTFVALMLDFLIGLLIGFCLIRYPTIIIQQFRRIMTHSDKFLKDNLHWLESYPAGFKLNVALTHRIGKEVRWILFYRKRSYASITAVFAKLLGEALSFELIATSLLQCMGLSTLLFGSRFFFAMAFDIIQLASLHIRLLSELFATCLRFEISALKSFWLLFTGKKRNVLRHRSDHLHYDHMQLLLGMLLFSTSLFLFTTVLVYHWFFTVTNFGVELLSGVFWLLHVILEGGLQCERILLRRRRKRSKDTWRGDEVQFVPVYLPEAIDRLDKSYFKHFYDEDLERNVVQSTNMESNVVSKEFQESFAMKIEFQSESDFGIASSALLSSISSVVSRFPLLLNRLFFGYSTCNMAHSFIEFTNSLIKGNA